MTLRLALAAGFLNGALLLSAGCAAPSPAPAPAPTPTVRPLTLSAGARTTDRADVAPRRLETLSVSAVFHRPAYRVALPSNERFHRSLAVVEMAPPR